MATRDEVKKRLAEVSHATWMLQSVRDGGRVFDELPVIERQPVKDPVGLKEAEKRLAAVHEGRSLDDLAEKPAQLVACHDRERAEESIKALVAMGIVFDSD